MKYILLASMVFFLITQVAMAKGETYFEQLHKASNQSKPVVELIDKASKEKPMQVCLISVGKGKVKEKIC